MEKSVPIIVSRSVLLAVILLGWESLAGGAPSQWYKTTLGPTETEETVCFSDMAMDSQGSPVIGFLREGSCPGPYIAMWETDHWSVEKILPQCLPSFSCGRTSMLIPIDVAVDGQDKVHVVFGTNQEGIQYTHRESQGWESETISTTAFPAALAVDRNGNPAVVMVSPQFDIAGTGQAHLLAQKTGGRWVLESVGTWDETYLHRVDIGSTGDVFIGFINMRRGRLLQRISGSFQQIFSITVNENSPLAFDLDQQNRPHLGVVNPQDLYPAEWSYGVGPPFSMNNYSRPKFDGGIDLAITVDGQPRVVFPMGKFSVTYGEWDGTTFSTETVSFGAWNDSFAHLEPIGLELSTGGYPYILNIDVTSPYVVGGLLLGAKLPPPLPMAVSTKTVSSVGWSWSAAPSPIVKGFRVRRSADNTDLSGILPATAVGWAMTGTNANEEVSVQLETIYPGFILASTPVASTSLPVPPANVELSRSGSGPLSANWSPNGNAEGTAYRVDLYGSDGTHLSETVRSPNLVYPFLNPQETYAMNVTTLGREGGLFPFSTVSTVSRVSNSSQFTFSFEGLTVEVRLFPEKGFPFPVASAGPQDDFSPATDPGWVGTQRGFQLVMDLPLPTSQGATVTVDPPSGWLDGTQAGRRVLARYDSTHRSWVPLPTREEGGRFIAGVDGWGTFQIMFKPDNGFGKTVRAAYPNPFRPMGGGPLVVRDVPPGSRVKVSTLDGRPVRTLLGNETGLVEWDGRDEEGTVVKSGVYLFSVTESGNTANLKVIVER